MLIKQKAGVIIGALAVLAIIQYFLHLEAITSYGKTINNEQSFDKPQYLTSIGKSNVTRSVSSSSSGATSKSNEEKKYAYAFLVAGCNPARPSAYRGYLYNILASTYMLKNIGNSTSDIIVMIRMASSSSLEHLPAMEEGWLTSAGITIQYLPRVLDELSDSFYTAMMDKFQILNMTTYERVIYMDSDTLPLCNLDYLFELSSSFGYAGGDDVAADKDIEQQSQQTPQPLIRDNLVIAWKGEPSQGGFFMLRPGHGELDELNGVIRRQALKAKNLWPPFDVKEGWGHNITPPDRWKNINGDGGTEWDFYGAFADQGLLFMWTKYVKKDVSMVYNGYVEHWWDGNGDGEVELNATFPADVIDSRSCSAGNKFNGGTSRAHAPFRDFFHFTGKSKPWLSKPPSGFDETPLSDNATTSPITTSPVKIWYHAFQEQVELLDLGNVIDIYNLKLTKSDLGNFPTHWHMGRHAIAYVNASYHLELK